MTALKSFQCKSITIIAREIHWHFKLAIPRRILKFKPQDLDLRDFLAILIEYARYIGSGREC